MQFPMQITQTLIIRNAAGRIIIQIGPTPDLWIYGQGTSYIHLFVDFTDPVIDFNDTSNRRYRIWADSSAPASLTIEPFPTNTRAGIYVLAGDVVTGNNDGIVLRSRQAGAPGAGLDGNTGFLKAYANFTTLEWLPMALLNGWFNNGGGYAPAQYRMLPDGTVQFEGVIKPGTTANGTVIGTFPAGYRVTTYIRHLVWCEIGVVGRLELRTNGDVGIFGAGAAGFVTASWCGQFSTL